MSPFTLVGRSLVTLFLLACGLFLCLGFWCSTSEWNATVLGRYTLTWFVGSLVANGMIVFVLWLAMRAVWQPIVPDSASDNTLSHRKRLLFGTIVVGMAMLGAEAFGRVVSPMLRDLAGSPSAAPRAELASVGDRVVR